MKKNTLKKAISAVAVSALALTASSVSAFAAITDRGMEYSLDPKDGSAATNKPVITATKKIFNTPDEAAGQVVTISIDVSGVADASFCTTGFHVYGDDRLEVQEFRKAYAKTGDAIGSLSPAQEKNGANGVMLTTMGTGDDGYPGTMWTIDLKVPANAEKGDVYPIDIAYQWDPSKGDLFTDNKDTAQGKLMQAYAFTQGTNSSSNPSTEKYLVKAGATFADGYIAIKDDDPETTTTTTSTSSTTTTTGSTTSANAESTTGAAQSTGAQTTTAKSNSSDNKKTDSPKTGVTGVGVAVAGLAVAVGTAFALKKKED